MIIFSLIELKKIFIDKIYFAKNKPRKIIWNKKIIAKHIDLILKRKMKNMTINTFTLILYFISLFNVYIYN